MTLMSTDRHVPKHADPTASPLIGPGSGYVGRRRLTEPGWLTALATTVMKDARHRAVVGTFAGTGQR